MPLFEVFGSLHPLKSADFFQLRNIYSNKLNEGPYKLKVLPLFRVGKRKTHP
jgi:hypothetical protein